MTSENSPPSLPANILGEKPAGLSDPLKLRALEIKARILAGENIPLAELSSFILSAESDLTTSRTKRNIVEKKTDVDFF